jgi:hypothetical protein
MAAKRTATDRLIAALRRRARYWEKRIESEEGMAGRLEHLAQFEEARGYMRMAQRSADIRHGLVESMRFVELWHARETKRAATKRRGAGRV